MEGREVEDAWARLALTERPGLVRIPVRVRPSSSRSAVLGVREGSLDVALQAAPADGAANAELVKLVARVLGVKSSGVYLAHGASSREKLLEVSGLTAEDARHRFGVASGRRATTIPPPDSER